MMINIESTWIDYRKHGRPFVRTFDAQGAGEFVEPTHTEWGKRTMKQFFSFDAQPGDLLQARLEDGSWKNDAKCYFRVSPDGKLISITQDEAGRCLAERKRTVSA